MATREEQRQEAIERIEALQERFELNPLILQRFRDDKVYYSYLTGGGIIPSIDTIDYDPNYAELVKEFERFYGVMVYHAIESKTRYGTLLSLLYVGNSEDSWEMERLNDDELMAYVVNFDDEDDDEGEFGYIQVMCASGALIRIG